MPVPPWQLSVGDGPECFTQEMPCIEEATMMWGRLAPLAIGLIVISLAGASLRWTIEPTVRSNDWAARTQAELQAAQDSLPMAYFSLAAAGFALLLSDRWPARAAGIFLTIGSGMLANVLGAFWLLGALVGIPLLIVASIVGRARRSADGVESDDDDS
jgi:hypothetical protein